MMKANLAQSSTGNALGTKIQDMQRTGVTNVNVDSALVERPDQRGSEKKKSSLWTHPELNRTPFAKPPKCEANVINQLHHVPLFTFDIRCNLVLATLHRVRECCDGTRLMRYEYIPAVSPRNQASKGREVVTTRLLANWQNKSEADKSFRRV